jgi:hypothetical protein
VAPEQSELQPLDEILWHMMDCQCNTFPTIPAPQRGEDDCPERDELLTLKDGWQQG